MSELEFIPIFKKIMREALPFVFLTILAEILAGIILGSVSKFYVLLPGLLFLVPGLLEARGNISSSFGQRLGTGLHLGVINWELGINDEMKENISSAFILNFILIVVFTFVTFITANFLGIVVMSILEMLFISVLTSMTAAFFQVNITIFFILFSSKRGLDPDNITLPVIAALGDIITVGCLFFVLNLTVNLQGVIL